MILYPSHNIVRMMKVEANEIDHALGKRVIHKVFSLRFGSEDAA